MKSSIIDQLFSKHFSSIGSGVRDEQRQVIKNVLDGRNTLSIMPTGSGKSLCYWIAGLALKGITLAIFPLTALMDEQSRKLQSHGLTVMNLHSGISAHEQQKQLIELRNGKLPDFIFVSPERVGNDGLLEFILHERSEEIKLVVVDEIHCISQWGHDFRPFYKEIPPFLNSVFSGPAHWPVVLGLTATLSQKDTEQLCADFFIDKENVFKSQYLLRYPIKIEVVKVENEPKKDILFWENLSLHKDEKILVYIENRNSGDRSTEGFCRQAINQGYKAAFFHANMTSEEKSDVIQKFIQGTYKTIFATSAFGMGIDIPDIRGVIHYRPPESIEQFYQQIGRVGRDGRPAWSLVYYSQKNINFRKTYFIDPSFPNEDLIRSTFKTITSGQGEIQSFAYFSETEAQTAFHYLLRFGLIKVHCKSIQKIDIFKTKSLQSLPKLEEYIQASKSGITTLVAKKTNESVTGVTNNIFDWWSSGKLSVHGTPQKCLMIEKTVEEIPQDNIDEILRDIEEKKSYRYSLIDQLVEILDGFTNSISLHQEIGKYLGVDKFQLDRIYQTISGEMVRSKSEVIIADLLTSRHIAFEYEKRLEAEGIGFTPDFTISIDRKTYYWEHLGRLDLEQYRQNWAIKKAWYDSNFPGQLITTEEGSTISRSSEDIINSLLANSGIPETILTSDTVGTGRTTRTIKVWTEGKTDWKHIKAAFNRLKTEGHYQNLEILFQETEEDMGDKELLNTCKAFSRGTQNIPQVFVFDRDVPDIIQKVIDNQEDYKNWGEKVLSVALPVPPHRSETPQICIEFYYQDEDIKQKDANGRRLYIGNEFNQRTGKHREESIFCNDKNKAGRFTIIDQQVFLMDTDSDENIALSKNEFANHVLNNDSGFGNFDVSGFRPLFNLLEMITILN